jgi:hypothetical protein
MLLVCIRLTIAEMRSGMCGDKCEGVCRISCNTKLPTKSDTELSSTGSKSLQSHRRTTKSLVKKKNHEISTQPKIEHSKNSENVLGCRLEHKEE